jgi:hypothetical protein
VLLKPNPAAVFLDDTLTGAHAHHALIFFLGSLASRARLAAARSLGRDLKNRNVVVMGGANGQPLATILFERVQRIAQDLRTDLKQLVGVTENSGQLIIKFRAHV